MSVQQEESFLGLQKVTPTRKKDILEIVEVHSKCIGFGMKITKDMNARVTLIYE